MKKSILMLFFSLIGMPGYTGRIDSINSSAKCSVWWYPLPLEDSDDTSCNEINIHALYVTEKGLTWSLRDYSGPHSPCPINEFSTEVTTLFVKKWTQEGKKVYAAIEDIDDAPFNFEDFKRLLEEQPFTGLSFYSNPESDNNEYFFNILLSIKREFPHIEFIFNISNVRDIIGDSDVSFLRMAKEKGIEFEARIGCFLCKKLISKKFSIPINTISEIYESQMEGGVGTNLFSSFHSRDMTLPQIDD